MAVTLESAFAAYRRNVMTDDELAVCLKAIKNMNETMDALDDRGYFRNGYIMLQHSLEIMTDFRKRDRKENI